MKENTSPKRRLFLIKGVVYPDVNYFTFMHPRVDVQFSASSLAKEEKSSFLSPNTLSFMIFQESICAKLGGTMKVFRNPMKHFS